MYEEDRELIFEALERLERHEGESGIPAAEVYERLGIDMAEIEVMSDVELEVEHIPTDETLEAIAEGDAMLASDEPGRFDSGSELIADAMGEGDAHQLVIGEYDKVRLKDGTVGHVVDLTAPGVAYLVEFPTPDGPSPYDQLMAEQGDIVEVLPDDYPMVNPYEARLKKKEMRAMFHKVKEVCPLPGMMLGVMFADGTEKTYDVKPLLARADAFGVLEDRALFESVEVDPGGYGVVWSDEVDISCDELWENGTDVSGFSDLDVTDYLETPGQREAYLAAAVEFGDEELLAEAHDDVARAVKRWDKHEQEGVERMAALTRALLDEGRVNDLKRAAEDPAYRERLWSAPGIIRPDADGVTVLPAEWDDPEDDGLYDDLVEREELDRHRFFSAQEKYEQSNRCTARRVAKLCAALAKAGRIDDIARVGNDEDYRDRLYAEFGL